jgi:nanoRNase/pAp phosphatase (c-di-AMP/oligoRNAs hydrolase)
LKDFPIAQIDRTEVDGEAGWARLSQVIQAFRPGPILVLSHRSPDPDALGALLGVRFLLQEGAGREAIIATRGRIQRAENVAMVRELGLNFANYEQLDYSEYAGCVLVDSQPGFGHTEVPEGVPILAVFDHHEQAEDAPQVEILHADIRPDVGATSSMVYEYIRDAKLELDCLTATSLFCGIRFDTADLAHDTGALDEEAYYATLKRADKPQLARIKNPALPADYYRELGKALRHAKRHGSMVLGLLGVVSNPEMISEMADFFLRMEDCHLALVGGAFEGKYYVSLRTQYRPAYPLLERILKDDGSFGGHGRIAGGQVQLDEENTDEDRRRLERRMRARALLILESVDGVQATKKDGNPIV